MSKRSVNTTNVYKLSPCTVRRAPVPPQSSKSAACVRVRPQRMTRASLPAARLWAINEAEVCSVSSREMARLTLEASDPCQIAPCPRGYLAPCAAREMARAMNCTSLLSEACFIARSCFDATPGAAAVSRQRCVLALHWSAANRRLYIPRNASERNCARRGLSVPKLPSSLMHLELIRPFNWTRQYFDDFRAPTVHPFGSTLCRAHTVGAAPVQRSASAAAQRSRCSPLAIDTSVWLLVGVHSTAEGR